MLLTSTIVNAQEHIVTEVEKEEVYPTDEPSRTTEAKPKITYFENNFLTFEKSGNSKITRTHYTLDYDNKNKQVVSRTILEIPSKKLEVRSFNDDFVFFCTNKGDNYLDSRTHINYAVYTSKKDRRGFILDSIVVPASYDSIGIPYLLKGRLPMLLVAKKKRSKLHWGIIDASGEVIVPLKYDYITLFQNPDIFSLNTTEGNALWIDHNKSLIGNLDGFYHNQKIIVKKKGKYGLLYCDGKEILPPVYDEITPNETHTFYNIKQNNQYGLLFSKPTEEDIRTWGLNASLRKTSMKYKDILILPKYTFSMKAEGKTFVLEKKDGKKEVWTKNDFLNWLARQKL